MMYLKFEFGRCLQDACIDIRFNRISRNVAIEMVDKYDGEYPKEQIEVFLDYYKMSRGEFDAVLDTHANKKKDGIWKPLFEVR